MIVYKLLIVTVFKNFIKGIYGFLKNILSNIKSIFPLLKKEVSNFLNSLTGYIVIIVFLLTNGYLLWGFPFLPHPQEFNILDYGYAGLDGLFILAPFLFLILIPAITMSSFADEKKRGTIELLLTKPLTDLQIVLAKYFAGVILVLFSLLPTLVYFYTVYQLGLPVGNIDLGGTYGSYIGLLLLGATFTSIGLFCSSITNNIIASFILTVFLCGFFYLGFEFIYTGPYDLIIKSIGISHHYSSISRGVIDSRDVIYYLSIISFFILLTKTSLQSRRW